MLETPFRWNLEERQGLLVATDGYLTVMVTPIRYIKQVLPAEI